jgi:membrane fusion protein, copper/silver efflux system
MFRLNNIITFGGILFFLVSCGEMGKTKDDTSQTEESNIYYTCSMDPQIKEDKPGKCPICHMDLTPAQENKSASDEIALSAQQIQLGNISTLILEESSNVNYEKFTGVLSVNQDKTSSIASRAMGRIEKLFFKTVGDYVAINTPIYELYSEDLAIAKQDYLLAYKQYNESKDFAQNMRGILLASKQKLLYFGLSENQIKQILVTKDVSPNTLFYSTVSGFISEILIIEGAFVMEGAEIIRLTELTNLWLEVQVNVNYINKIQIGQSAKVTFNNFPEKKSSAKIKFVNPEINSDTRMILVRMEVPNSDLELKPGMQAFIELMQSNLKGLFIPIDAVIREEHASYVWLEKEKGLYRNVMVETGEEVNGLIEIKSGIEKGSKVVVSGAYAINSEYRFRKGANPMEGHDMSNM